MSYYERRPKRYMDKKKHDKKFYNLNQINALIKGNKLEDAYEMIITELEKDYNNPYLLLSLAMIYIKNNDFEKAKNILQSLIIEKSKNISMAITELRYLCHETKEFKENISLIEEILDSNISSKISCYLFLGEAYYNIKNYDKSEYYYNKTLENSEYDNDRITAVIGLGRIGLVIEKYDLCKNLEKNISLINTKKMKNIYLMLNILSVNII